MWTPCCCVGFPTNRICVSLILAARLSGEAATHTRRVWRKSYPSLTPRRISSILANGRRRRIHGGFGERATPRQLFVNSRQSPGGSTHKQGNLLTQCGLLVDALDFPQIGFAFPPSLLRGCLWVGEGGVTHTRRVWRKSYPSSTLRQFSPILANLRWRYP